MFDHKLTRHKRRGGFNMMMNQVPNLNQYPVNQNDERFGFLPFVGGLAVGALAGGFGGSRPCCAQVQPQPPFIPVMQPIPMQQPMLMGQPPIQPIQPFPVLQGPILETNKYFMR